MEERLHDIAQRFMACFTDLEPASLDEFLLRNADFLSRAEMELGQAILAAIQAPE